MRWISHSVLVLIVMRTALAGSGVPRSTSAQDATPDASPRAGQGEGFAARTLAVRTMDVLRPGTAALALGRIVVAPGRWCPLTRAIPLPRSSS